MTFITISLIALIASFVQPAYADDSQDQQQQVINDNAFATSVQANEQQQQMTQQSMQMQEQQAEMQQQIQAQQNKMNEYTATHY